ncbi:hypothetical protein OB13_09640 [Pontibacter sp. HJ8]
MTGILLLFGLQSGAQSLQVATYNIRYDNKSDTANAWHKRLPVLTGMIQFQDFDIFGTQEALHHQVQDLLEHLPGYAHIGVGRDDGKTGGEFSGVFYKKARFDLLKQGTFWLSTTPDKPSKSWDAALPRICTWGQFRDKVSGRTFFFFNTHFDHRGQQARAESVKLILKKIKEIAPKAPVILAGDFNFDQADENYTTLNKSGTLQDAYHKAKIRFAPMGTFNDFKVTDTTQRRIDHIFLTPAFQVQRYGILTFVYGDGKLPSDHFPVVTELEFN